MTTCKGTQSRLADRWGVRRPQQLDEGALAGSPVAQIGMPGQLQTQCVIEQGLQLYLALWL